jgi:alkylation response protein AidB-like acyl-CoA dehydrogenase
VNFGLSEEQALLREAVERFAASRYDLSRRAAYRASPTGYSAENWAALAEIGLLALPFPPEDGGLGGGPVEIITVMEVLGRALAVEPVLEEVVVAGGLLVRAGTRDQKDRWLPAIMDGSAHLALAHFEHSARFNLAGVQTHVRHSARGAELHGAKTLVPVGEAADAFIVSARDDREGDGPAGIRLYLAAADAPGLQRRGFRLADGSAACCLVLDGAIGEQLDGDFRCLSAAVQASQIAAGAEMLGIMSMLFDATLEYVRTRRQFGAALGSFQVIQHRLVDLYVLLELSRSQLYNAALCNGGERERAIAGMKSYLSSAALTIGEHCIQLHGAMGTTDELPISHGHKRLLVLATLFGDADSELERYMRLTA